MAGTLRAALVPYEEGDSDYEEAIELLDTYAGAYPTKGKLKVRVCIILPLPVSRNLTANIFLVPGTMLPGLIH